MAGDTDPDSTEHHSVYERGRSVATGVETAEPFEKAVYISFSLMQ